MGEDNKQNPIDDRKMELFYKQKETLDIFLEHHNITKAEYDRSLNGLIAKMGIDYWG